MSLTILMVVKNVVLGEGEISLLWFSGILNKRITRHMILNINIAMQMYAKIMRNIPAVSLITY